MFKEESSKIIDLFYKKSADFFNEKKNKWKGVTHTNFLKSEQAKFLNSNAFMETRFLDFPIPSNIDISEEKVLLISWDEDPTAILISSRSVAQDYRKYFEEIWKIAKKA